MSVLCAVEGLVREGTLTRHIRGVHNGEKRHKCVDCGKAFARKQGMMKHMKACNTVEGGCLLREKPMLTLIKQKNTH